ncbi:hypothetical protein R6Q57_027149 [Mikania cordata]
MNWSSCPFCTLQVLSIELEMHANSHFEDEDEDEDLAMDEDIAFDYKSVDSPMHPVSDFLTSDENICSLVSAQARDANFNRGFMALLKNCLELECEKYTSTTTSITILSGYVDHFQSLEFEDVGWGCGWRNIQMLASHLLVQRQEAKEVLFGGVGFVPDIPSLQRWLEIAWGKGFDVAGSNDFDQKIYGKRAWIGTTECAALFRSFGIRAHIVDFCFSTPQDVGKSPKVVGPIDRYLNRPDTCGDPGSSTNAKCFPVLVNGHQLLANWVWSYFSDNSRCIKSGCSQVVVAKKAPLYFQHDGHSRTIVGIQLKSLLNGMQQFTFLVLDPVHVSAIYMLISWYMLVFANMSLAGFADCMCNAGDLVFLTLMHCIINWISFNMVTGIFKIFKLKRLFYPPFFFHCLAFMLTLYYLKWCQKTQVLESCLRKKVGWQRFIKRGVHTLKKTEYQVMCLEFILVDVMVPDLTWLCFSCVMWILELPLEQRWRNLRPWTAPALNFDRWNLFFLFLFLFPLTRILQTYKETVFGDFCLQDIFQIIILVDGVPNI